MPRRRHRSRPSDDGAGLGAFGHDRRLGRRDGFVRGQIELPQSVVIHDALHGGDVRRLVGGRVRVCDAGQELVGRLGGPASPITGVGGDDAPMRLVERFDGRVVREVRQDRRADAVDNFVRQAFAERASRDLRLVRLDAAKVVDAALVFQERALNGDLAEARAGPHAMASFPQPRPLCALSGVDVFLGREHAVLLKQPVFRASRARRELTFRGPTPHYSVGFCGLWCGLSACFARPEPCPIGLPFHWTCDGFFGLRSGATA